MKYLILVAVLTAVGRVTAQVAPSSDPLNFLASLGVSGLISVVVYLWQRDTAKQRDTAMALASSQTEALREIKTAIELSTEAHERGTDAARAMTDTLQGMPPRETWVRVIDALDRRDRASGR